ncbi:MAG: UDP-N-acetyl-D-mannosaminuronic acid transferase [Peptococcaceae bacterium BICA1-8]|nr:MAG: UDP-N-acetyl-D-mannosaminuronic acid transferase [Peptococcaceae bacterium BICA1-8]
MINYGKYPLLGINISAVDYEYSVAEIIKAAHDNRPLAVSALAVHGVMTGYLDQVQRRRINGLDLVLPDGQPVRWGLNWKHKLKLLNRVYGPELMLRVINAAANEKIPFYLYGSTEQTINLLKKNLQNKSSNLIIAGMTPSKFRRITINEKEEIVEKIKASGAKIVLVGLGCPRQEVWVFEYRNLLKMPLLAVGAAFDFHAGVLNQAPPWMQKNGLEWFYRFLQEPRRLFKRYVVLNPYYLLLLFLEVLGLRHIPVLLPTGKEPEKKFG